MGTLRLAAGWARQLARQLARLLARLLPGLLPGLLFAQAAAAQVVVGQTADLSGPAAASVAELNAGARLLIDAVNRSGGVHGQAIRLLGPHARGVVVRQVFPPERALDLPLVQQAVTLARATGVAELSPAMMEGFVSARLLVEALRRAGPRPDRARIAAALAGLGRWDLGGLALDYRGGSREGIAHVELSIITADGRFRR